MVQFFLQKSIIFLAHNFLTHFQFFFSECILWFFKTDLGWSNWSWLQALSLFWSWVCTWRWYEEPLNRASPSCRYRFALLRQSSGHHDHQKSTLSTSHLLLLQSSASFASHSLLFSRSNSSLRLIRRSKCVEACPSTLEVQSASS